MSRSTVELRRFAIGFGLAALLNGVWIASVNAGMPAVLPSSWTADSSPDQTNTREAYASGAVALRIQAISFFLVVFLLSGWLVKGLSNSSRRDFQKLPRLRFGRSLGLVALWGLLFVIVLTMISGAR